MALREENFGGFFLVFWWKNIPLGQQQIPMNKLPTFEYDFLKLIIKTISPALFQWGKIKNKSLLVNQLILNEDIDLAPLLDAEILSDQKEKSPSVSVVICTRDRPHDLQKCLASLQRLFVSPKEIIVVDNASKTSETANIVNTYPNITYVYEPKPGLSIARNTGIKHSTGEIVAFTDDDIEVHPYWVDSLAKSFAEPLIMAATGPVIPTRLETEAEWLFENNWGLNKGYCPQTYDSRFLKLSPIEGAPIWDVGAGANMAIRREVFSLLGYFEEVLGAGASGCSEDSELWYRILAKNFICKYEPAAVVFHTHRSNIEKLRSQIFYYMRGHAVALIIQYKKFYIKSNLMRLFLHLPMWYVKRLLQGEPIKYGNSTLFIEIWGVISGVHYFFKHYHKNK